MKNLIIFIGIVVALISCNSKLEFSSEDKDQIYNLLKSLNQKFIPENEVIILNSFTNEWILFDASGTSVSDEKRLEKVNNVLNEFHKERILTIQFLEEKDELFEINSEINVGILLTNNKFGNYMVRVLPSRLNIGNSYCLEEDWEGDEEYLNMTDKEFESFLKTRITPISTREASFSIPYAEASITPCNQHKRKYYSYNYYFIKSKEGQWLINDIRIEKNEN